MVAKQPAKDAAVQIKFGGGLHTRASSDEIDPRESADGQNFLLDLENRELRPRPAFDLVGRVPTGAEIRGGGSLLKADGTVSTIFQAAGIIFEWDGGTGFTPVGTCDASAKLRGNWRSHNWTLGDKVLLSDLTLNDVVKEWDGTTFQSVAFTNTSGSAFATLGCKYIEITNERAFYGNIKNAGNPFPHLLVGSKQSNYLMVDTTNVPASALGADDPFFMTTPDLKPINGIVGAFGTHIISTEKGSLYDLSGTSAKDFSFSDFFLGSAASGAESLEYIGTDIVYGRQGRLESVRDTAAFGNSEADDLSKEISDQVEDYTGWTTIYNGRLNRAYFFPDEVSEVWLFNNSVRSSRLLTGGPLDQFVYQSQVQQEVGKLSPWMRWKTTHPLSFRPTFVMSMLDPVDGLEYVMMGDSSGNVYRLEGADDQGDGGSNDVTTSWTTKLFSAPLDAEAFTLEGYIKYKKNVSFSVSLTFLAAGKTAFDHTVTFDVEGTEGSVDYWGDPDLYWGGDGYWGARFQDRLIRRYFDVPGQMSDFQVRVEVTGINTFNINEIGLRLTTASQ